MSEESSISWEETNKIRAKLGLKLIPIPNQSSATPLNTAHKESTDEASLSIDDTNRLRLSLGLRPIVQEVETPKDLTTEQYQLEKEQEAKNEIVKEKLENLKQKAMRRKKINVFNSITDEGTQDEDTDDWLSKIKRPNPEDAPASKKAKKSGHNPNKKDDNSLRGVKVRHSLNDLEALNGDVILTLKDRSILDDHDGDDIDELESSELLKKKKLEKELAEKLRPGKYDTEGNEKGLLAKYDEELDADEDDHFLITGDTIKAKNAQKQIPQDEGNKTKKLMFSLDSDDENVNHKEERSDYAEAKPIKMKKLKKKTSKVTKPQRRKLGDDDQEDDIEMKNVDLDNEDLDFQDDLELQSLLSLKRIENFKKRKKISPEELAREIKEAEMDIEEPDRENGIVIDENVEFLSSIKNIEEEGPKNDEEKTESSDIQPFEAPDQKSTDDVMEDSTNNVEAEQEKPEDIDFAGGLASTLSFLKSKNAVKDKSISEVNKERETVEVKKAAELNKLKLAISQRIHKESLEKDSNLRKLSNKERELFIKKELEQFKSLQGPEDIKHKLDNYKPEISLKYIDELGREMNTKEAYKHLSHQFHGKAPNKSKVEKKLKKFEQERNVQKNEKLLD